MTKPEFGLVDPLKPMPILWTDREENKCVASPKHTKTCFSSLTSLLHGPGKIERYRTTSVHRFSTSRRLLCTKRPRTWVFSPPPRCTGTCFTHKHCCCFKKCSLIAMGRPRTMAMLLQMEHNHTACRRWVPLPLLGLVALPVTTEALTVSAVCL